MDKSAIIMEGLLGIVAGKVTANTKPKINYNTGLAASAGAGFLYGAGKGISHVSRAKKLSNIVVSDGQKIFELTRGAKSRILGRAALAGTAASTIGYMLARKGPWME